ncbi:MAG TPA: hypothetical protein VMM36_02420 [Opitutaceae bacterium]|nr:hypothetical protein [Opitutaceae bacterium]
MPSTSPVIYGIDGDDMIVGVSRAWDRFAVANATRELVFGSMIRRRLWDHISDATTVSIYHEVLERVRNGTTITLPLRCDAPTLRRWLKLTASPMPSGGVRFVSRTIRQEVRPYLAILDPSLPRSKALLTTCGWCRKFHIHGNAWVEAERAVREMNLFEQTTLPQLTHGICPVCVESMLKLESDELQSQVAAMS